MARKEADKPGPERRERKFRKIVQPTIAEFEHVGDFYEGVYTASKQVPFTERGRGTRLNWLYTITPEDGSEPQGVWGSQFLDDMMKQVGFGQYVRITFTGERPPKVAGQNPMRIYEVDVEV